MTREEKIALLVDELEDIRCDFDADAYEDAILKEAVLIIKTLKQLPCDDCISRQEVLDILKDKWNTCLDANDAMQESINAIKALQPVTPKTGRWIPVSERLPEKNGRYLAYIINPFDDKLRYIMTCEYFVSEGWCPDDECSSDNVVAWMPLPEEYREEQE